MVRVEHWDVRPDLLTAGKDDERLRPFGFAAASGRVHEAIASGPGSSTGSRGPTTLGAAAGWPSSGS